MTGQSENLETPRWMRSLPGAGDEPPEFISLARDRISLLTAGGLIPETGFMLRPGWLRVKDGRVEACGGGTPAVMPEALEIRRPDLMLAPGLIDAHVHLSLGAGRNLSLSEKADRLARSGIIGLRDAGDRAGRFEEARKALAPRIKATFCGPALYRPGRYGEFLGRPAADASELRAAARELAAQGADQIKVLASGPVNLERFGVCGPPQYSQDELDVLVRAAHEAGKPVAAHANGPEAARRCLLAGVDSLEHGYFMGRENLELMAERGVFWIPTLCPLKVLADREADAPRRERIGRVVHDQMTRLVQAAEMGVRLAIGTDAGCPGVPHGDGFRLETQIWLEAGLSAEAVHRAATLTGAAAAGFAGGLGSLQPGFMAHVAGWPVSLTLDKVLVQPPVFVAYPES